MAHSIVKVFEDLQETIRVYVPRCDFYFGEDDANRNAQPPKIIWDVDGGDSGVGIQRAGAVSGAVSPRPHDADRVKCVALVMGAPTPSTAVGERDTRRQAHAASEHLMNCLRWALRKSHAGGYQGIHEFHGYSVVEPTTSERGALFQCEFDVLVQIVEPEPVISEPPHTATFTPPDLEI